MSTDNASDVTNNNNDDDDYVTDGVVSGLLSPASPSSLAIEALTLAILWSLSVIGNILVCLVIHRSRRIQSTTNYFVISLAMSDLSLSVVCVPFVAARVFGGSWLVGQFFCKMVRFVQHAAPSATVFVLVSICVDRFYTIIYPLSFKVTRGTAKRMIMCSWISASVISCLCFYFFEVVHVKRPSSSASSGQQQSSAEVYVCPTFVPVTNWAGLTYILVMVICQFVLPVLFIVVGYTRVISYIWTAGAPGVRTIQRTSNPVPRAKVKMVKMLLVVTATTVVMFIPFYMAQLVYCFQPWRHLDRSVFILAFWLVTATCTLKPLLYLYYNTNFRRGCKEVFCMSTMRCYRSNTYAITTASVLGKKNYVGIMDVNSNGL
nr:hypothetical protein BaRGS_001475 [Batillaria attramentaria]